MNNQVDTERIKFAQLEETYNKALRANRSETRKDKLFNRSIYSENTRLKSKNKYFNIKKRSQTPNTSRYNTYKNKNQKYRGNIIGSAYSRRFEKLRERVLTIQIKNID